MKFLCEFERLSTFSHKCLHLTVLESLKNVRFAWTKINTNDEEKARLEWVSIKELMIDKEKSCDTPPKTKNKTQNQECPLFRVCAVRSVHRKTSIYFVIAFIYTMILLCIHINITYIYCSKTLSVTLSIDIFIYKRCVEYEQNHSYTQTNGNIFLKWI